MVVMLNSVENCNQYNLWCSAWRILDWQYFKCNWSCASAHFDQHPCVQVNVEEVMRALFGHTVSCHLWEECIVCSFDRGWCKRSTGMTGLVWMQCEQLFFFLSCLFLPPIFYFHECSWGKNLSKSFHYIFRIYCIRSYYMKEIVT